MLVSRGEAFHQNVFELLFIIHKYSEVKGTMWEKMEYEIQKKIILPRMEICLRLVNKIIRLWDHPIFTATVREQKYRLLPEVNQFCTHFPVLGSDRFWEWYDFCKHVFCHTELYPWSRDLADKRIIAQLGKKYPTFWQYEGNESYIDCSLITTKFCKVAPNIFSIFTAIFPLHTYTPNRKCHTGRTGTFGSSVWNLLRVSFGG
jgi:hypothetical protein